MPNFVMKYFVVAYDRDPNVMPVAVFHTDSIEKANLFISDFEKKQLPVATEIVLDLTEGGDYGQHSAA